MGQRTDNVLASNRKLATQTPYILHVVKVERAEYVSSFLLSSSSSIWIGLEGSLSAIDLRRLLESSVYIH